MTNKKKLAQNNQRIRCKLRGEKKKTFFHYFILVQILNFPINMWLGQTSTVRKKRTCEWKCNIAIYFHTFTFICTFVKHDAFRILCTFKLCSCLFVNIDFILASPYAISPHCAAFCFRCLFKYIFVYTNDSFMLFYIHLFTLMCLHLLLALYFSFYC